MACDIRRIEYNIQGIDRRFEYNIDRSQAGEPPDQNTDLADKVASVAIGAFFFLDICIASLMVAGVMSVGVGLLVIGAATVVTALCICSCNRMGARVEREQGQGIEVRPLKRRPKEVEEVKKVGWVYEGLSEAGQLDKSTQPPNNQQVEGLDQNSSNPNNQGVNSLPAIAPLSEGKETPERTLGHGHGSSTNCKDDWCGIQAPPMKYGTACENRSKKTDVDSTAAPKEPGKTHGSGDGYDSESSCGSHKG